MKTRNLFSKKLLAGVLLFVCAAVAAPQTAGSATLTGGVTLTESTSVNDDFLGYSVAVSGDRMIAGAPGAPRALPDDRLGPGYAVIFDRSSSGTWSRAAKLVPSDGERIDAFGYAVSVSGSRAIVGAPVKGFWRGAAYIFERSSSGTWSQVAKFTGEGGADAFGVSVSISGDRAIVGATDNGASGSAYVYRRNSSGTWSREARLRATAGAGESVESFGAGVSILGDRAIVGAPRGNPDGSTHRAGAAYIFERTGGTWSQHRKLTAGDKGGDDNFGQGVALASDGRAIVGARHENGDRGAAYIFERSSDGNYAETAKLTASDRTANDKFGWSVAISSNGNAAIVGTENTGKTYVFKRNAAGSWCQTQRLSLGNNFGHGVSISNNNRAAVGAPKRSSNKGAAYVYNFQTTTGNCQGGNLGSSQGDDQGGSQGNNQEGGQEGNQEGDQGDSQEGGQGDSQEGDQGGGQGNDQRDTMLQGGAVLTESTSVNNDFLGRSVAVSVSGNRMIAGAPGRPFNRPGSGYVLIFDRSSTGTWSQEAKLVPSDGATAFGHAVSVSGDRAIVGAPRKDNWTGATYIFERRSNGTWSQVATFAGEARDDSLGYSVSISGDRAIAGAREENGSRGAAYVYKRNSSGTWSQEAKLTASDRAASDFFGWSVAISGERAIIGAPFDDRDSSMPDSGSAYIFEISSGSWTLHRKLVASDRTASDFFGRSVAISSNGRAAVGANGENGNRGAAYVFARQTNGDYAQTAKLTASDRTVNDKFGWSVSISNDGNAAIVGTETAGKAYVFTRDAARSWRQTQRTSNGNWFGYGVSISNDRAAVGAPWHNSAKGATYVYNLVTTSPNQGGDQDETGGGTNPAPGAGETGPTAASPETDPPVDPAVEAAQNEILNNLRNTAASSVAVSADTAVVGLESDAQNGEFSGSALIFERSSDGSWSQTQKVAASDARVRGFFGTGVAVSGSRVAVGAAGDDTNGQLAGAVYIFDKSSSGTWSQTAKLLASDGTIMDFLGRSVSVSGDTVIAGADGYNEGESVLGAVYIFERSSDGTWTQTQLLASDGEHGDSFGESVSMSGDRVVIGAPRVGDNGQNSGAVYIFERDSDGTWTQVVKLSPDDGERGDFFGESVSISGDRAIVGSELDADEGLATGSAYIFERDSGGAWTQVRKLTAGDDAEVGDRFGESVSISGDRAVVGVNGADSAYVYKRNSEGAWALEEKLTPDAPAADYFGDAVAVSGNRVILISSRSTASIYEISSDDTAPRPDSEEGPVARASETVTLPGSGKLTAGDGAAGDLFGRSASVSGARAIVGATGDRNNGVITGSAYVFEKGSSGSWTQVSKLLASDGAANDGFGISVSISGNRAIAGALNADGDATDPGAAYVFERGSSGAWTQVQKLTAGDAADNDTFGTSVSMSGDRAIVGNTNDDDNGSNSGSAYVFDRNSEGAWSQSAKLLAGDGARLDEFGASVSVSGDRAIVGNANDDDNGIDSGSAYVFDRNSEGAWSQSAKLTPEDGTAAHSFGRSVSVSGNIAVVGADGDGDGGTRAGAAYVFERSTDDGTWAEVSKLTASDAEARDTFGRYVSVSGNRIMVGAEINGDNGAASGSAYVFERNSDGSWSETTKLLAGDGAAGDLFGGYVAISGNTAVIAAPGDDTGRGSVYVYEPSTSPPSGPGSDSGPGAGPGGVDDRSGSGEVARLSIAADRPSGPGTGSGGCAVSSAGSGGDALLAALALMLIPTFAGFRKRKRT